ncbi:MAG TPA: YfcE family phosphodiesterase [Opitutae bacterium]|nr:YfcE family phosphodiesterase [Opitutae bacterium]
MASTCIGLISDTHGLVRPQAIVALEGVDLILHAGDVCSDDALDELAQVAPVLAVAGNCDDDPRLPAYLLHVVGGVRILLHHSHLPMDESLHRPDIVITGHSHQPTIEQDGNVLRINPGSAGPRRFRLPVTVARLTIIDGKFEAELIELDGR